MKISALVDNTWSVLLIKIWTVNLFLKENMVLQGLGYTDRPIFQGNIEMLTGQARNIDLWLLLCP